MYPGTTTISIRISRPIRKSGHAGSCLVLPPEPAVVMGFTEKYLVDVKLIHQGVRREMKTSNLSGHTFTTIWTRLGLNMPPMPLTKELVLAAGAALPPEAACSGPISTKAPNWTS